MQINYAKQDIFQEPEACTPVHENHQLLVEFHGPNPASPTVRESRRSAWGSNPQRVSNLPGFTHNAHKVWFMLTCLWLLRQHWWDNMKKHVPTCSEP